MEEYNHKKCVNWNIFVWALGIILLLFGVIFNFYFALSSEVNTCEDDKMEIRTQLSQIQTDILWIKLKLK